MQTARSSFALKWLPSLGDFAFLMPIAFLFGRMDGLKSLFGDCDTGWHIRAGEWILANRRIPTEDIFSFSKAGSPWFAWEWLSEIFMAWLNGHGGLRAVAMFGVLMISATIGLLYFLLMRRRTNPLVAIAVTLVAAVASSIHWMARPHLFTLLLVVLFYAALESMHHGRSKWAGIPFLVLLPAATVLWTNLHGGFFVGVLLCLTYAAGEVLAVVFSTDAAQNPQHLRLAKLYALCGAGCLTASLVNPYTYHLHAHMLAFLNDPYSAKNITEFLSPNFHHPTAVFFESMLVMGAGAACWSLSQKRFTELLLVGMWAHASLLANRNIPLFAIVAAPVVARAIQEILETVPAWNLPAWLGAAMAKFRRMAAETGQLEAAGRWHLVSAAGLLFVAAVMWAPHPPKKFRAEFDPDFYPAGAMALLRQDTSARIFTHDEWGDYLIWSLYPSHRVFIDGRSDFYGTEFEEKNYIDVLNAKYGWENTLDRFGVNTILLPPSLPFAGTLKESKRWRVVYDDGVALVFQSTSSHGGKPVSVAGIGGGECRGREVTKTQASSRLITDNQSNT